MKCLKYFLFFVLGVFTTPRLQAQIPVTDVVLIAQTQMNGDNELMQWVKQIEGMREQYALAYAAYTGLKDWRNFGWTDELKSFELPWFDGVPGIEDLRNLAAATSMSSQELQRIFGEFQSIQRMQNDPLYQKNEIYKARVDLWSKTYSRVSQRRITLVRMAQRHDQDLQNEVAQLRGLQSELENLSAQNPVPQGAVSAVQGKINLIQAKMAADNAALDSQKQILRQQEEQEIQQTASQVASDDFDFSGLRAAQAKYWDHFSSSHPGM